MLSAVLDWLKAQKKTDLKGTSGGTCTSNKEGQLILQNQTEFYDPSGSVISVLNAQG